MSRLRQYERDETPKLRNLLAQMNQLHANMGGRDTRPERIALQKCMHILDREIQRAEREQLERFERQRQAAASQEAAQC